jgi:glycerate dehydrogenase
MRSVFLDFATVSHDDVDPAPLRDAGTDLIVYAATPQSAVGERIRDIEIVITNKLRLDRQLIEDAPRLRLVCLAATGTDNVDLAAAADRGVGVCNITGYCTRSVVQHVFAVMLSLTQHVEAYRALLRAGAWRASPQFCLLDYPIRELAGRTLGIIGLGELGQAVATVAGAFGMRVLVAERPGGPRADGRVALDILLATADVVSLHCPLKDNTRGLIGARELSLMRNDALLINTARGALIDSAALAEALRAGQIGGAAIDVLSQEPPVDGDPLLADDIPNLIVTPHVAWAAREARQRAVNLIADNIRSFLSGGTRGRVV